MCIFIFKRYVAGGDLCGGTEVCAQWVTHIKKWLRKICLKPEDWRAADGAKSSKRQFSELFKYVSETDRGWHLYFQCGLPSAERDKYTEIVHSLKAKQLHKWPQLSPRNTFQRRINGVCCYDGARLAVARFGNTVAKETTQGAKGSCRQSADALWVNPFKHDLLLSFVLSLFLLQRRESPP